MAAYSEQILDDTGKREQPLGLLGRLEATPLSFPLACRRMRSLPSIVGGTLGRVSQVAEAGSQRGRIASQSVGEDAQQRSSWPA
jgi:hypothetical protein